MNTIYVDVYLLVAGCFALAFGIVRALYVGAVHAATWWEGRAAGGARVVNV